MHSIDACSSFQDFENSTLADRGYLQGARISGGTFSNVYRLAKHRTTYALKKMTKTRLQLSDATYVAYREKRALEELTQCPFIITLHDSFQDPIFYCLVLEHVSLGDFMEEVNAQGHINIAATRHYTAELILALEYMRELGFIHRDIKPGNMLLGDDRHLKLCDFGLSKRLGVDPRAHESDIGSSIRDTICGTPGYQAPEVVEGGNQTFSTDLWSLGCVIYCFQMGYHFFRTGDDRSTADSQQSHVLRFKDGEFEDRGEPSVKDLVEKLLVYDPELRLGAQSLRDLKIHVFYGNIPWDNLQNTPPPPLTPRSSPRGSMSTDSEVDEIAIRQPRGGAVAYVKNDPFGYIDWDKPEASLLEEEESSLATRCCTNIASIFNCK